MKRTFAVLFALVLALATLFVVAQSFGALLPALSNWADGLSPQQRAVVLAVVPALAAVPAVIGAMLIARRRRKAAARH
jgi:hypothetical protein